MPYYTAEMARYMKQVEFKDKMKNVKNSPRKAKIVQFDETEIDDVQTYASFVSEALGNATGSIATQGPKRKRKQRVIGFDQLFPGQPPPASATPFDQRRLMYLKNLLNRQVKRISNLSGPLPIDKYSKEYSNYEIIPDEDFGKIYNWVPGQTIHKAIHKAYNYLYMIALEHTDEGNSFRTPIYFKILQHLGKKHQYILPTWDIFLLSPKRTVVFQECSTRGDLGKLIADNGKQPEVRVQQWARQLYHALSYLGDMAICHNNLIPAYITLNTRDLNVRLTGFYQSVVYWSAVHEKVMFFPCRSISERNMHNAPDFKALEVYGDGDSEQYDPIAADLWSYGAILFYAITGMYPHNYEEKNPNVEEEIQSNIDSLTVSKDAKSFLKEALTTHVLKRLTFDRVVKHPWIFKQDSPGGNSNNNNNNNHHHTPPPEK